MLIPLLFMGDVVGRLFREFAITLAVAILISAAVSLTLCPDAVRRSCSNGTMPDDANELDARWSNIVRALIDRYGPR